MTPAAWEKSSIRDIVNMYMSSFIGLGLYRFVFLAPAGDGEQSSRFNPTSAPR